MISFERSQEKKDIDVSVESGRKLFTKKFGPKDGIHHVFNANACITCHDNPVVGGFSANEDNFVRRVSKYNKVSGQFDSVISYNFPVAKRKDARRLGMAVEQKAGIPTAANIVSMRMPPSLLHIGHLDEVLESALMMHARSKGDGIQGRINYIETVNGKKIGRYGLKANQVSLINMVADALATEIGLDNSSTIENQARIKHRRNDDIVESIAKFLRQIDSHNK